MHYIQKHILDQLRTVKSKRYAELNNHEIESGHFRYHINQLVRDGYVGQVDRGLYVLTPKGEQYVDTLSSKGGNAEIMPKVITYTLLKDGASVLLHNKDKQPYMGLLNMIGGKLHYGETAQQAAIREVYEKTGQTITEPELQGIFEIQISKQTELFTHVIAYVFSAEVRASSYQKQLTAIEVSRLEHEPKLAPDFWPLYKAIRDSSEVVVDSLWLEMN